MSNQLEKIYINNDESFASYIYQDVHNENRIFWRTMFTVLGMFFLALGYILGKGENGNPTSEFGSIYFLVSQLIWLIAMIEVLLFSNFNWKRKFLIQVELFFKPSLETEKLKEPFWEHWANQNKYPVLSGYTIAAGAIISWGFLAFIWVALKASYKILPSGNEVNWILAIILFVEFVVGTIACVHTLIEYKKTTDSTKEETGEQQ
jgi:hypothetical protein